MAGEVLLLYVGFSGAVVLCTVLPVLYMRREQLRRIHLVELHAPLLAKYARTRDLVACVLLICFCALFLCFCLCGAYSSTEHRLDAALRYATAPNVSLA